MPFRTASSPNRSRTRGRRATHRRMLAVRVGVMAAVLALLAGCTTPARSGGAGPTTTPPSSVTLMTADGAPGTYLTDGAGRALYMWDADREGSSTCYGDCAVDWPPLTVSGNVTAGPKINAALIGKVPREDGTSQVTYGGWPLYYYVQDVRPGQLAGQGDDGFGAVWWVVSPAGQPLPSPMGN